MFFERPTEFEGFVDGFREGGMGSSLELDFWRGEKKVLYLAKGTSKADPMAELMVAVKQMEVGMGSSLEMDFWSGEKKVFHLAKGNRKADPTAK